MIVVIEIFLLMRFFFFLLMTVDDPISHLMTSNILEKTKILKSVFDFKQSILN